MQNFNTQTARAAQKALTQERKFPHFAPVDGICYRCNQNIYQQLTKPSGNVTGISVEHAGISLVTGCPHCNCSYCD